MNTNKKSLNYLSLFFGFIFIFGSCSAQDIVTIDALVGTWKIENKETYEVWQKEGNGLTGKAYKLVDGEEKITETLAIELNEKEIIYKATVPNQNAGKTIPFTLDQSHKKLLSFENPNHDFPKKIQYKWVEKDRIHVSVLGEGDQEFSYFLLKQ